MKEGGVLMRNWTIQRTIAGTIACGIVIVLLLLVLLAKNVAKEQECDAVTGVPPYPMEIPPRVTTGDQNGLPFVQQEALDSDDPTPPAVDVTEMPQVNRPLLQCGTDANTADKEPAITRQKKKPTSPENKQPTKWPEQVAILPCGMHEWIKRLRTDDDNRNTQWPKPKLPRPSPQNCGQRHNRTQGR